MRQRLAAGEQVARMYREPGLAWLEGQAEAAEQLLTERQAGEQNSDVWVSCWGWTASGVSQPSGPHAGSVG
jgi:hypothetical protein